MLNTCKKEIVTDGGRKAEGDNATGQQRREAVEMQLRMEEIQRAQETEGEDKDKDQEMGAGPSVPKKQKMEDKVSFCLNYNGKEQKLTKKYF